MRNFDFIRNEAGLKTLWEYCNEAEINQTGDPAKSALYGRMALEWIVQAIYYLKGFEKPEHASLFELVTNEQFTNYINSNDLIRRLHYIRKAGNNAAHGMKITGRESFFSLLNLYEFVGSVLIQIGAIESFPRFRKDLIPKKPEVHIAPTSDELPDAETIKAEYPHQNSEPLVTSSTPFPTCIGAGDETLISEAETRRLFIDQMLREAGWDICETRHAIVAGKACIETEVSGMPTPSGKGYADYVLFGDDGKPLAVVEAKKAVRSEEDGRQQAELYAQSLERTYGVKPVIYFPNGFTVKVIDQLGYTARTIMSFHSKADLQLLHQRQTRKAIQDFAVNKDIAGREYQIKAVKAVCERLNKRHRRSLIVMATGTGKTRVAIAIAELLMRNNWIKNVLFLADRISLVNQAHKNFVKLLPNETTCVLSDHDKAPDLNARIMFSTYQTMIGYIDEEEKDFSIGRFDLIFIDEAHRSVFGKYGALFDYFDSLLIGLTATPRDDIDHSTYHLLDEEQGEPTADYSYDQAVADGYLCPYKLRNLTTPMLRQGIHYDDLSKEQKEQLEGVWTYEKEKLHKRPDENYWRDIDRTEINKYIYNKGTIDSVLKGLMTNGLYVNDGMTIGKTIIFGYDHEHAQMIVDAFQRLYPELGPDFCQLIDYSVYNSETLLDNFERRNGLPQVVVSVDMLDTGVDIPDCLNLVFFKPVRSKIRFFQMIGRGTRLSPGIFGPRKAAEGEKDDNDKKEFLIFDWCGNFDFFSIHGEEADETPHSSLEEKLFDLKLDIAVLLQEAKYQQSTFAKSLHDGLKKELLAKVSKLPRSRIDVRKVGDVVYHFQQEQSWQHLSPLDVVQLKEKVAPVLPRVQTDFQALRFDFLMFKIEISLLDESQKDDSFADQVYRIAKKLASKASIPQVYAKMTTINEVLSPEFWQNKTLDRLEFVRKELRDLVQFLKGEKGQTFEIDIDDPGELIEGTGEPPITGYKTYKDRVMDYLEKNKQSSKVLQKIYNLEQLNEADILELEKILWKDLGTEKEYEDNVKDQIHGGNVAAYIRSIIGIDRQTAIRKFEDLLKIQELNSEQMDVLESIIEYVCQQGDITSDDIMSPVFENTPWNVFGDHTSFLFNYVSMLHQVIEDDKKKA